MGVSLKSILLEHLPDNGQAQAEIVMDTFDRFYRISQTTSLESEMSKERLVTFQGKSLGEIKKQLDSRFAPFLAARNFCEEIIRLDLNKLDKFKTSWSAQSGKFLLQASSISGVEKDLMKRNLRDSQLKKEDFIRRWGEQLKNLSFEPSNFAFDMGRFISDWIKFRLTESEEVQRTWDETKVKFSDTKKILDQEFAVVTKITTIVETFSADTKGINKYDKELASIEEELAKPEQGKFRLDPVIQKCVNSLKSYNKDRKHIEHEKWILHSIVVLENLTKDILLAAGVPCGGWNFAILQEVLRVIHFIHGLFEEFKDKLNLPEDVKENFQNCLGEVELAWLALHEKFLTAEAIPEDVTIEEVIQNNAGKTPAKTIRELYILNAVSQEVFNGKLKYGDERDHRELKSSIFGVLSDLQEKVLSEQADDSEVGTKTNKHTQSDLELSWAPKMIAVVLDSRTPFLLTGASHPACSGHFALKELANKIPHAQVGAEYNNHLSQCYRSYRDDTIKKQREEHETAIANLAKEDTSIQWSAEELEKLFPISGRAEVYNKLPSAAQNSMISCWAINPNTFELKPPCPRCAYLYPSWDLHKTEEFYKRKYVLTYLNSGKGEAKDGKQFHCAETVAAAQMYAWRHESLGFN